MATFNGVWLKGESVQAAREWFAENCAEAIIDAESGLIKVNDLEAFREWQTNLRRGHLRGDFDHTLTAMQRAYFIQTGESVALLP